VLVEFVVVPLVLALPALVSPEDAAAQPPCALTPQPTGRFDTLVDEQRGVVAFSSGLAVNADGAPNAYHRVLGPTARDPGLLHICNGVAVLERRPDGRMANRYPDLAAPGASASCKADVFALQERGFPACETGECLRVFGFFAPPRSCGVGAANECGVPPFAKGPNGAATDSSSAPRRCSIPPSTRRTRAATWTRAACRTSCCPAASAARSARSAACGSATLR
jgi:hypothetical protein